MANKREQRLRRKGKAKLGAVLASSLKARALMPIAISAIRYIGEIDAPDLREPWSIDSRRRELAAIVHAYTGTPPERRATVVGPTLPQPLKQAEPRMALAVPARARVVTPPAGNRIELLRDLDLKRREMRLAAQRFGAVANDRGHRTDSKPLEEAMVVAARAFVRAEDRLAGAGDARRSA